MAKVSVDHEGIPIELFRHRIFSNAIQPAAKQLHCKTALLTNSSAEKQLRCKTAPLQIRFRFAAILKQTCNELAAEKIRCRKSSAADSMQVHCKKAEAILKQTCSELAANLQRNCSRTVSAPNLLHCKFSARSLKVHFKTAVNLKQICSEAALQRS